MSSLVWVCCGWSLWRRAAAGRNFQKVRELLPRKVHQLSSWPPTPATKDERGNVLKITRWTSRFCLHLFDTPKFASGASWSNHTSKRSRRKAPKASTNCHIASTSRLTLLALSRLPLQTSSGLPKPLNPVPSPLEQDAHTPPRTKKSSAGMSRRASC